MSQQIPCATIEGIVWIKQGIFKSLLFILSAHFGCVKCASFSHTKVHVDFKNYKKHAQKADKQKSQIPHADASHT